MTNMTEKREKRDQLARDVLTLSRNTLLVNLRFLDAALSQFKWVSIENGTLLTDGAHIICVLTYRRFILTSKMIVERKEVLYCENHKDNSRENKAMGKNRKVERELHKLLERTLISPDVFFQWCEGNKEAMIKCLQPLENYFRNHAPSKLYKLRRVSERSLSALEKDELYLTRADQFNDPFDCLLSFDVERLKKRICEQTSNERMEKYLTATGLTFPIGNLFHDKESLLTFLDGHRNEFVMSTEKFLPAVAEKLQSNTYVASLTTKIESPIMWAHYANDHKGFAIEYQFASDFFAPKPMLVPNTEYPWYGWRSLLPMQYSDRRADGTSLAEWYALCEWNDHLLGKDHKEYDMNGHLCDMLLKTKLCLQKAREWEYEHEWRLILSHNWPNQIGANSVHILYPASAIYLGERMSTAEKAKLKKIAGKKGIPVYEMCVNQDRAQYEMDIKPYIEY